MRAATKLALAVVACAVALATAAALPAVWWEPLHLDERVMLEYAPDSPGTIVREVFVDRGGAPLQFLVEHVTLQWPGGLAGLRLPSFVFFLLALGFSWPVAWLLVGERAALALPLLLASAPLAVELATFGRMYALFLWLVLAVAWLALRAGRSGTSRAWIAAGALAGGLVYVHPIAPLYAPFALACGLAADNRPLREALARARPGLVAAIVVALPYVYALAVLRSRLGLGEAGPLSTTAGRSVPEEALHGLTPGGSLGLAALMLFAAAGAVRLVRERPRPGVLLVLWVVVPVVFFTFVPAETRFFARYVLPALPAFLLLVACGCTALARGRRSVAVALVAVVLVAEAVEDVDRLRALYDLELRGLPGPARTEALFSSTGSPRSDRPPELLDDLVALADGAPLRVEELPAIDPRYEQGLVARGSRNVAAFLSGGGEAGGLWLFRGAPRRVSAAAARLAENPAVLATRVGDELLVVRSRRQETRRRLVELAAAVRVAWGIGAPRDRWPRTLVLIDRSALG